MHIKRLGSVFVVAAFSGTLLLSGSISAATTSPTAGAVHVFVTPTGQGTAKIVITGAIGDYGKTLTTNKNGTTDPDGNYATITLKKGTFKVNKTALNTAGNNAQPTFAKATCSAEFSVVAPVTVYGGTGLYKGITGTISVSQTEAFLLPFIKSGKDKGQCNESNSAQPVAQYGSITGSGTVAF